MSLEESEEEEEEEGGEGLQGTNPTKMLSGRCRTPGAFLLCHGEVRKDTQQPPQQIGVVWGHQKEPLWDVAWLGQTQLRGASLPPLPLPRQLIQEGRRWDAPSSGHEDIATPGCHATTWQRVASEGDVVASPAARVERRGGASSSHPSPAELPRGRKGPAPDLRILLTPSPGRGWKMVDNKTNKKNVGRVIDC